MMRSPVRHAATAAIDIKVAAEMYPGRALRALTGPLVLHPERVAAGNWQHIGSSETKRPKNML